MSDIKSLLTGTPISAVMQNRPLVYLGSNSSIADVLELLSSHGILSAPVFSVNPATGAVGKPSIGTLLGFVDVWAVLVAFLQSLPPGMGGVFVGLVGTDLGVALSPRAATTNVQLPRLCSIHLHLSVGCHIVCNAARHCAWRRWQGA